MRATTRRPSSLAKASISSSERPLDGPAADAVDEARKGVELAAGFSPAHWPLTIALGMLSRHEEAIAVAREAVTLAPKDPTTTTMLAWACVQAGNRAEATNIVKRLEEGYRDGRNTAVVVAHVLVALGDYDEAFRWLSRAYDERDGWLSFMNHWPTWRPLRSDPRFQALLRKMNFPEQQV